jgi:hypothetical protein
MIVSQLSIERASRISHIFKPAKPRTEKQNEVRRKDYRFPHGRDGIGGLPLGQPQRST